MEQSQSGKEGRVCSGQLCSNQSQMREDFSPRLIEWSGLMCVDAERGCHPGAVSVPVLLFRGDIKSGSAGGETASVSSELKVE